MKRVLILVYCIAFFMCLRPCKHKHTPISYYKHCTRMPVVVGQAPPPYYQIQFELFKKYITTHKVISLIIPLATFITYIIWH